MLFFSFLRSFCQYESQWPILTAGGVILLVLNLVASGCAGFIPAELQEKIQRGVSLQNLQQDAKTYKGQLVLLGGEILDVKNRPDGDRVEVLQRPLDASDRPNLSRAFCNQVK